MCHWLGGTPDDSYTRRCAHGVTHTTSRFFKSRACRTDGKFYLTRKRRSHFRWTDPPLNQFAAYLVKRVHHPGLQPQPFMREALHDMEAQITSELKDAFLGTLNA